MTERLIPFGAALFLALIAGATLYAQRPPDPAPVTAPPDQFSSGRARWLLKSIARSPHPTGSPEAAAVRRFVVDRLFSLGLKPEIQRAVEARSFPGRPFRAARIENIVVRIPGSGPPEHKALLLSAHTDSVPHSPGASDDGAAVAALLETIRALKAGPPLKRDVIFLFTDGEELGLMGASAFLNRSPLAKDVGLVLNFEARGNGGPSYMFETSTDNGALVRGLAAAAPAPDASSLMYAVYHAIPNDSDLTLFKRAGIAGLNFAFVGGLQFYHSPGDSLANLDERSLQHQGSYALSLARYFGNHPLPQPREQDVIYFNGLFGRLVSYPASWARPIAILTLLLFIWVFYQGARLGKWTTLSAVKGAAGFLLLTIGGALLIQVIWIVIRLTRPGTSATSQSGLYATALTLFLLS
ncbi:MAG TPA: M20/M25/M40 family metallo-hydrolase, partial [Armatimonadota bacterium]|nr:M20/M25/M40 family metallo-hydrolase [Armatimonadota bacterium]